MSGGGEFEQADILALREKKREGRGASYHDRMEDERRALTEFDGRRARVAGGARAHQLNVRVRQEVKEMVYRLSHERRYTMTELVERAIEEFFEREMRNS